MADVDDDDVGQVAGLPNRTTQILFLTGVGAMATGVILIVVAMLLQTPLHLIGALTMGAGAGLMILAIKMTRGWGSGAKPTRKAADIRDTVATHAPPFWVCTRCNNVMEENLDGRCTECQSFADCLEVKSEDDREIALAALGD